MDELVGLVQSSRILLHTMLFVELALDSALVLEGDGLDAVLLLPLSCLYFGDLVLQPLDIVLDLLDLLRVELGLFFAVPSYNAVATLGSAV